MLDPSLPTIPSNHPSMALPHTFGKEIHGLVASPITKTFSKRVLKLCPAASWGGEGFSPWGFRWKPQNSRGRRRGGGQVLNCGPSLKLTASLHRKMDGWNTVLLSYWVKRPIFRCELAVSFREGREKENIFNP